MTCLSPVVEATLEAPDALRDLVEVDEVVRQDLALQDREDDLDLVEPARMNRGVHEGDVALDRCCPRWLEPLSQTTYTLRAET